MRSFKIYNAVYFTDKQNFYKRFSYICSGSILLAEYFYEVSCIREGDMCVIDMLNKLRTRRFVLRSSN